MRTPTQKFAYTVFLASIGVAVLGGILLVVCQLIGLVFDAEPLVTAPNGVFKTTLCIAASVSSLAVYFLVYVKPVGKETNDG
ncbi:hypothetical protein ABH903_002405 [Brevibacterium epidermidis]|jgi:hypothetical protein|uniref:Uncharacterized protein n=1 Tax=Brevibacterium epidermidis TaxID=1698 RepID=A0ABV4ELF2_BREEP